MPFRPNNPEEAILQLLLQRSLQPPLNSIQILIRSDIVLAARLAARQGQVLGHDAVDVNSVDAGLLEALGKGHQLGGVVELAALDEAAGPGEDGGNGVGRGLAALLVLAVVAGDGAVGGLGLKGLAVGGDEDGGHEAEGAEALGDNVGLDITVVVCGAFISESKERRERNRSLTLEGHDVAAGALDHLGNHVVNQTVLVPDALGLKFGLVLRLVQLLEDVLESTIVLLEDGVLCAHVQGQLLVQGQLERGVRKTRDGFVRVVLGLGDAAAVLELEDLNLLGLAALGGEDHGQLAGAGGDEVLCAVLVAKGVAADDDGLLPAGDEAGDAVDDDGLAEDGAAEGIADGAVGREPH